MPVAPVAEMPPPRSVTSSAGVMSCAPAAPAKARPPDSGAICRRVSEMPEDEPSTVIVSVVLGAA